MELGQSLGMRGIKAVKISDEHSTEEQESVEWVFKTESDEKIGDMVLKHYKRPFEYYYLTQINIVGPKQGKGYGTEIIKALNENLQKLNAFCITTDRIWANLINNGKKINEAEFSNLYLKNGWTNLFGEDNKLGGVKFIDCRKEKVFTPEQQNYLLDKYGGFDS